MDVDFHQLNLTRELNYLPLSEWLVHKKAIINPLNKDQECFKWAVIAASRWEDINKNPQRISKLKKFEVNFDWSGIGFLVSFRDIEGFESRNQISINILAIESRQIYICRKGGNYELAINLPFLGLADNFFESNAFQTIFSLHFVMETIFLQPFLKNVTGFFYRSYLKEKHFLGMHTHEKSHLNETNSP